MIARITGRDWGQPIRRSMYVRGLPAATGTELMLYMELGMKSTSLKGLNHSDNSFVSRRTKGCKWPGLAGHGGP